MSSKSWRDFFICSPHQKVRDTIVEPSQPEYQDIANQYGSVAVGRRQDEAAQSNLHDSKASSGNSIFVVVLVGVVLFIACILGAICCCFSAAWIMKKTNKSGDSEGDDKDQDDSKESSLNKIKKRMSNTFRKKYKEKKRRSRKSRKSKGIFVLFEKIIVNFP